VIELNSVFGFEWELVLLHYSELKQLCRRSELPCRRSELLCRRSELLCGRSELLCRRSELLYV